jgi:ABC-type glycerol-3-phosphate transport system permease component
MAIDRTYGPAARSARALLVEALIIVTTLVTLLFLVYPTAWVIIASFRTPDTMFAAGDFKFTLDNYRTLLASDFAGAIFNSMILCLVSVIVSTFVSVIAAYVFSRKRFRWKSIIFGSVMLGQTFPWIILVTPMFILFAKLGLLNSHLGMVFVYVAVTIPFSIYSSAIWNPCRAASTKRPSSTAARSSR